MRFWSTIFNHWKERLKEYWRLQVMLLRVDMATAAGLDVWSKYVMTALMGKRLDTYLEALVMAWWLREWRSVIVLVYTEESRIS